MAAVYEISPLILDWVDLSRSPQAAERARNDPSFAEQWEAQQRVWCTQLDSALAVPLPDDDDFSSDDESGGAGGSSSCSDTTTITSSSTTTMLDPPPSFVAAAAWGGPRPRLSFATGPRGLGYYSNHEVIPSIVLCSSAPDFASLRAGLLERGLVRPKIAPVASTGKELMLEKLLAFYTKVAPAKANATKLTVVLTKYRHDIKRNPIPLDGVPAGTLFAGHDILRRKLAKKYDVEWSSQDVALAKAPARPTKPKKEAALKGRSAETVAAAVGVDAWAWTGGVKGAAAASGAPPSNPSTPPRTVRTGGLFAGGFTTPTGGGAFASSSFTTPPAAAVAGGGGSHDRLPLKREEGMFFQGGVFGSGS